MKKSPYYQFYRALADGCIIEEKWNDEWVMVVHPDFSKSTKQFRVRPDADGWIPWYAHEEGEMPPELEGKRLDIVWCDHSRNDGVFGLRWVGWNGNIIKYRLSPRTVVKTVRYYSDGTIEEIWND